MTTKGKFYIWLNTASTAHWYWVQDAQNWTSDPAKATLFDTREQAEAEAKHATAYSDQHALGGVHVSQATKDI